MGMRLGSAHGSGVHGWQLLIAGISVLALLVTLGATAATAAKPATCAVTNTDIGKTYMRLQQAVNAAKAGTRLFVKGTCIGGTVIDKDLVIVGVRTERSGAPSLSGGAPRYRGWPWYQVPPGSHFRVRVLAIEEGVHVTLRGLHVIRGRELRGAGILNRGNLILADVVVRGNDDGYRLRPPPPQRGAAIFNAGILRLQGATRIVGNVTFGSCAGVANSGTLVMSGTSTVADNMTDEDASYFRVAGVCNHRGATFTMNGTSSVGKGQGMSVRNQGTMTMNDASWIEPGGSYDDSAFGLAVENDGTVGMNDRSSIRNGGPYERGVTNSGSFTMNDRASLTGLGGGGVDNRAGTFTMNHESSVNGNTDACRGGGVELTGGSLVMTGDSSITGNAVVADTDVSLCDVGRGGGIYHSKGTLTGVTCGPGGNVHGNTPDDCFFE